MSTSIASEQIAHRTVIVDDHTLVRQSLVKTVSAETGFEVAGEAGSGEDALRVIAATHPNIVLLDIGLPGQTGLDVAAQIRERAPDVRILFLTMRDDEASISRAVAIGADGYVTKTASTAELLQALHAVAEGTGYLSPTIARRVMDIAGARGAGGGLTDRELEILQLLATGARPAEVGKSLFVSVKTVKNHLTNIYAKLGVQSGVQAVAEAYRRGLVARLTEPRASAS